MLTGRLLVVLTCLAALGSSLIAGVFLAFSAIVMTALGRLPPHQGIAAMQSINIAVINPWFFAAFFGTAAASAVLAIASLLRWGEPGAMLLLAGGGLYLVGSILVTMLCNVPLNDALAAAEAEVSRAPACGSAIWSRGPPGTTCGPQHPSPRRRRSCWLS